MSTLTRHAPIVKPASPRDDWPGPGQVVVDGPRPTAGPDFQPAPEDDAEWLSLKLALAVEAEDLDHDAMHSERMEAAFGDPFASIPHDELVRGLSDRVITFPACVLALYPAEGGAR